MIQIFCQAERKSLHFILQRPFHVLQRPFHEKLMTCEKNVCPSNVAKEGQWDDFFNHSNVTFLTEEQR